MMAMNLRSLDLNLLLVFEAILREGSVARRRRTPASQPAGHEPRVEPVAPPVERPVVRPHPSGHDPDPARGAVGATGAPRAGRTSACAGAGCLFAGDRRANLRPRAQQL